GLRDSIGRLAGCQRGRPRNADDAWGPRSARSVVQHPLTGSGETSQFSHNFRRTQSPAGRVALRVTVPVTPPTCPGGGRVGAAGPSRRAREGRRFEHKFDAIAPFCDAISSRVTLRVTVRVTLRGDTASVLERILTWLLTGRRPDPMMQPER